MNYFKFLIISLLIFYSCSSIEKEYYDNGVLKKEYKLKNGEPHGLVKFYFPNGKIKETTYFENGIRNGLSKGFYTSGEIEWQINYTKDLEDGLYQEYFKNGNLKHSCFFRNGLQDSILVEKYENGSLKAIQNFKKGVKHGVQKTYYESGSLKLQAEWDSDIVIYYKKLNEDSTLINEYRDIVLKTDKSNLKLGDDYIATVYIPGFEYLDSKIELHIGNFQKTKKQLGF